MGRRFRGVPYMKKVFVLAVIGAACSSVAFAGEVKQTKTVAPVVKATTMSDAQMDKVVAGDPGNGNGGGHAYAFGLGAGPGYLYNNSPHSGPK
jgi:hypothetical protein